MMTPSGLRAPGSILLLSFYEMGHQPLNVAAPLAHLRRAGFEPAVVDTSIEHLPDEAIRRARLVAFSVPMHTATRLALPVAERVRRLNPPTHLSFFGLYAWLNREHLLDTVADSIIAGEFEGPLVALAEALDRSEVSPRVEGISTRTADHPPALQRLPFLPPARETLPSLDRYAYFRSEAGFVPAGYVEATRGCLHRCTHCPITPVYGGRFFAVPRDVVLADIEAQIEAGARHITFGDPDFLNGPTHARRLVRALHEAHPTVTWDATIKVEHILEHEYLFEEFAAQGCAFVVSAIESFSPVVLQRLEKGHTPKDAERAIRILRDAGITLRPTFLPFTPWTCLDDYLHLLDRVDALGLAAQVDPVQYTIRLLVPPGSALLDQPDAERWFGPLQPARLSHAWMHPDPKMDALQREVTAIAEEAVADAGPPLRTFRRIRAAAQRHAGHDPVVQQLPPTLVQPIVPGLTEAWFC